MGTDESLLELENRFRAFFDAIKSSATVAASLKLHDATPAELGAVAHAGAKLDKNGSGWPRA